MARRQLVSHGSMLLLAAFAALSAQADEARVLDSEGRVLTIGNWRISHLDGGSLRTENDTVLSYELADSSGETIADGVVPGSEDGRFDATPVLSRNPVTGRLLAVWSRGGASGTREIVGIGFEGETVDEAPVVLASGANNQLDPDLIHDRAGNAYLVWRDMEWSQPVRMLVLDSEGRELSRRQISTSATVQNGAPRIGVDATGTLFVAYLALDAAEGEPILKVHGASEVGGGVIHVPSPIIELGRVAELAVSDYVPAPGPSGWESPRLEVTILGGTPVLWWLADDALGRPALHHAIRTSEGDWSRLPIGRILLPTIGDEELAVHRVLELLEARFRSVVSLVPTAPPVGSPGQVLGSPKIGVWRR